MRGLFVAVVLFGLLKIFILRVDVLPLMIFISLPPYLLARGVSLFWGAGRNQVFWRTWWLISLCLAAVLFGTALLQSDGKPWIASPVVSAQWSLFVLAPLLLSRAYDVGQAVLNQFRWKLRARKRPRLHLLATGLPVIVAGTIIAAVYLGGPLFSPKRTAVLDGMQPGKVYDIADLHGEGWLFMCVGGDDGEEEKSLSDLAAYYSKKHRLKFDAVPGGDHHSGPLSYILVDGQGESKVFRDSSDFYALKHAWLNHCWLYEGTTFSLGEPVNPFALPGTRLIEFKPETGLDEYP